MRWLQRHQGDQLWLSVFTLGEIQQGIVRASDAHSKELLAQWLAEIRLIYREWIIPFGEGEATLWGSIVARLEMAGRNTSLVDSMIAATALFHEATVVTRNVRDFAPFDVPVVDPCGKTKTGPDGPVPVCAQWRT